MKKKINLRCFSDLDWNQLPLTYDKYQGSAKLKFDLLKNGYMSSVSFELLDNYPNQLCDKLLKFYSSDLLP